jgi:Flp pilus assembly protein TadG
MDMYASDDTSHREQGQILIVFALSLVAIILAVGLVIDGGNAWSQRRSAQNLADFAALAGTKVIAANLAFAGTQTNTTVKAAVEASLSSNGLATTVLGTDYSASYVDVSGALVAGYGPTGAIPAGVVGVQVSPSRSFRTYFLGVVGMPSFTASATATARAGSINPTVGGPGGNLVPIAVNLATIAATTECPAGAVAGSATPGCTPLAMTQGDSVAPGQFQWMSWDGTGDTPYLCSILGPPANSPSFTVPANGYINIPGNTGVSNSSCVRGQASPLEGINGWVSLHATILVPIISPGPGPCPAGCFPNGTPYPPTVVGTGSNATYNVIGFAGFELTGCSNPCVRNLEGVFRQAFFLGPTGSSPGTPGTPGSQLAIQLVR